MEKEYQIDKVLEQTLTKLKSIIDIDSIIGKPIHTDTGETIIPLLKVLVGFVAGGGEYQEKNKKKRVASELPFAGGSGGGFNISPIGFLIISSTGVRMINVDDESNLQKIFDVVKDMYKNYKKD